ncbi:MAG: ATP-binding protein [Actinobacteria bacterium]|nr:ATP-binding protein [Actinomycetota bacterium]
MEELEIKEFYFKWQERLRNLIDGYIYDKEKNLLPTRNIFLEFKKIIERFISEKLEEHEKIILMPGIRGVGKTTLLMQLLKIEKLISSNDYFLLKNLKKIKEIIYIDTSFLKLNNISLNDFFNFYERLNEFIFESLKEKIILLLDEVHYDENWGLFLKSIFDRTKSHSNILIIATGSSAINLIINPDLSRRVTIKEIFPLKFTEYLNIKHKIFPAEQLSEELKEIIFNSSEAASVCKELKNKKSQVEKLNLNIYLNIRQDYFETGGFPFTIKISTKTEAIELVKNVINSIIIKDIISLKTFKTETISKINSLIYLLAGSGKISYEKLQQSLKIPEFRTLNAIIEVLVMSGLLIKVSSLGRSYGAARKTPKFLFISPTLRSAILDNFFSSDQEGTKLEDYFALLYQKDLKSKLSSGLAYDISDGGADFILTGKDRKKIIIEIGFSKEEVLQILNTKKKVNGKYGLVFGSRNLELVGDFIVKIPLEYLLLI